MGQKPRALFLACSLILVFVLASLASLWDRDDNAAAKAQPPLWNLDGDDSRNCLFHCTTKHSKLSGSKPLAKDVYLKDRAFFDSHYAEYRAVEHRDPPMGYDRWLQYARANKCLTSVRNYSRIMTDLKAFRNPSAPNDPTISRRLIHEARRGNPNTKNRLCSIGPGGVRCSGANVLDKFLLWFYFELWDWDFGSLFPRPVEFVWSIMDEPVSLPVVRRIEENADALPFVDMDDVYARSSCLRENYPRDKPPASVTGFLNCPVSFTVDPRLLPIFSMTKLHCFADIVLPHEYNVEALKQRGDPIPWSEKTPSVFWRGASTGGAPRSPADWQRIQRFVFLQWAKQQNAKNASYSVDAAFSKLVHCGDISCDRVVSEGGYPLGKHVGLREQLRAKFMPAVDGNTFLGRMLRLLSTHQLILYAGGPFIEWYSDRLLPWVHYVPIASDFSDLSERLEWAIANDAKSEKITQNANTLADNYLRVQDMNCYSALALLEYASLVQL